MAAAHFFAATSPPSSRLSLRRVSRDCPASAARKGSSSASSAPAPKIHASCHRHQVMGFMFYMVSFGNKLDVIRPGRDGSRQPCTRPFRRSADLTIPDCGDRSISRHGRSRRPEASRTVLAAAPRLGLDAERDPEVGSSMGDTVSFASLISVTSMVVFDPGPNALGIAVHRLSR